MRKAHKINVFRFVGGNSGKVEPIGFIWRHGEIGHYVVPTFNGAATPVMKERRAIVVQIAGEKRFVTRSNALEARDMPFEVTLCAWDRDPSGLYEACEHCNGKGYNSAPKTGDGFEPDEEFPEKGDRP
jgi:hypothetical protein